MIDKLILYVNRKAIQEMFEQYKLRTKFNKNNPKLRNQRIR